uniref:Uncharacterized protein n=1 Tax=Schistosoma haematobium TaxID=6185 RepID=A0A094ZJV0_SCHHA
MTSNDIHLVNMYSFRPYFSESLHLDHQHYYFKLLLSISSMFSCNGKSSNCIIGSQFPTSIYHTDQSGVSLDPVI